MQKTIVEKSLVTAVVLVVTIRSAGAKRPEERRGEHRRTRASGYPEVVMRYE